MTFLLKRRSKKESTRNIHLPSLNEMEVVALDVVEEHKEDDDYAFDDGKTVMTLDRVVPQKKNSFRTAPFKSGADTNDDLYLNWENVNRTGPPIQLELAVKLLKVARMQRELEELRAKNEKATYEISLKHSASTESTKDESLEETYSVLNIDEVLESTDAPVDEDIQSLDIDTKNSWGLWKMKSKDVADEDGDVNDVASTTSSKKSEKSNKSNKSTSGCSLLSKAKKALSFNKKRSTSTKKEKATGAATEGTTKEDTNKVPASNSGSNKNTLQIVAADDDDVNSNRVKGDQQKEQQQLKLKAACDELKQEFKIRAVCDDLKEELWSCEEMEPPKEPSLSGSTASSSSSLGGKESKEPSLTGTASSNSSNAGTINDDDEEMIEPHPSIEVVNFEQAKTPQSTMKKAVSFSRQRTSDTIDTSDSWGIWKIEEEVEEQVVVQEEEKEEEGQEVVNPIGQSYLDTIYDHYTTQLQQYLSLEEIDKLTSSALSSYGSNTNVLQEASEVFKKWMDGVAMEVMHMSDSAHKSLVIASESAVVKPLSLSSASPTTIPQEQSSTSLLSGPETIQERSPPKDSSPLPASPTLEVEPSQQRKENRSNKDARDDNQKKSTKKDEQQQPERDGGDQQRAGLPPQQPKQRVAVVGNPPGQSYLDAVYDHYTNQLQKASEQVKVAVVESSPSKYFTSFDTLPEEEKESTITLKTVAATTATPTQPVVTKSKDEEDAEKVLPKYSKGRRKSLNLIRMILPGGTA